MSPTYKAASKIIATALHHKWEIIPKGEPTTMWDVPGWKVKKGRITITIWERRDGGLMQVTILRQASGGSDITHFPPSYKDKLGLVLRQIEEGEWLQWYMTPEWLKWWKSLDHTCCSFYGPAPGQTMEEYNAMPFYQQCRSMHCSDCGRTTGSQGHRNCPERKPVSKIL